MTEKRFIYIITLVFEKEGDTVKRTAALILSAILLFICSFSSFAVTGKDERTPAPEISDTKTEENENGALYTLTFSHKADEAEAIRKELYAIAIDLHGSEEKLMNSAEAYLCHQTKLFCEISTDGESWFTLKEASSPFSLSLYDEILPLLRKNGIDFNTLCSGFDFYVRILMASENFKDENTETVYVYTPSEKKLLTAPAFSFIHLNIPSDVKNDFGIPCYFTGVLEKDTALPVIHRNGYIFDGWALEDGTRINKIPMGTEKITVTAHFIPKTYEINYVVTKNFDSHFGRVDLSKHPTKYTVGTETRIQALPAPLGYVFCGWYDNESFTGEKITAISADKTGDIVLWAKWKATDEAAAEIKQKELSYIKEQKFGDADGDGKISASDARFVLRSVVGLEEISYEALKRVDYYGTNKISSLNARTTLRIAVGLDDLHKILSENGLLPTFNVE